MYNAWKLLRPPACDVQRRQTSSHPERIRRSSPAPAAAGMVVDAELVEDDAAGMVVDAELVEDDAAVVVVDAELVEVVDVDSEALAFRRSCNNNSKSASESNLALDLSRRDRRRAALRLLAMVFFVAITSLCSATRAAMAADSVSILNRNAGRILSPNGYG